MIDPQALMALESRYGADSLLDFIPRVTRGLFSKPQHLRPLADVLARACFLGGVRACTSTPPRHGKTETLAVHGIPWYLSFRPHHLLVYVTSNEEFARDISSRARDIAREIGLPLRLDTQNKSLWKTPQGGGLLATSKGSRSVMGRGFNLMIVDDIIGSQQDAESQTIRDMTGNWFEGTLATRGAPDGSIIVNSTRWHPDDLIGRLTKHKEVKWQVVNLPAIKADGQPLWPEVWPLDKLDVKRRDSGPYVWPAQYMGQPVPRGGAMFPREKASYFRRVVTVRDPLDPTQVEHFIEREDGKRMNVASMRLAILCDPAATAKTSADYTVIGVAAMRGLGGNCELYLLDMVRSQVSVPQTVRDLKRVSTQWPGAPIGVESVGGFKAVPQMLREQDPELEVFDITPNGDKFTRSLGAQAGWMDARVFLPEEASWVGDFLDEVAVFTGQGDAHDDQVDVLAHAWKALYRDADGSANGEFGGGW